MNGTDEFSSKWRKFFNDECVECIRRDRINYFLLGEERGRKGIDIFEQTRHACE